MASYFIDPAINANSGTGTIGDPFGDLQYALNTVTRDGTNGDRFNIKSGTAEVLTATLSLATYGTPNSLAGICFRGYNLVEGDGGVGEISGSGLYAIWSTAFQGTRFVDLILGNCGTLNVILMTTWNAVIGCKIHGTSGNGITTGHPWNTILSCWFTDIGGYGVSGGINILQDCLFTNGSTNSFISALNTGASETLRCCFYLSGSSKAISVSTASAVAVVNCSFLTTGTSNAISTVRPIYLAKIRGCIFEGFATCILLSTNTEWQSGPISDNAFYNCTTDYAASNENVLININNETLASSPFAKVGTITSFADRLTYFANLDVGNIRGFIAGLDKGAIQSAGGGTSNSAGPLRGVVR